MKKIIYLDTNIFLHYQPFDQCNWLDIVKADSATIIIPPITVRELNNHKDSHHNSSIKMRAGEILRRLSKLLDLGDNAKIINDVKISFEDRDPTIDFSIHHLNFLVQDDQLIASILMNKQESPNDQIVLVTSDLGLTLLAKAGRHEICTQKMPENLKIADEPDPNVNKVKKLEQQIRELNSRIPKLSLIYKNGQQHAKITLPQPISHDHYEIEEKLTEIKNKFPIRNKEELQNKSQLSSTSFDNASNVSARLLNGLISEEEFERYNNEVRIYFSDYRDYILRNLDYENINRRTIRLDIILTNDGTMPAEDIDIYLHFPDGFQLLEEDELPNLPEPPKPPVEPMTTLQQMVKSMSFNQVLPYSIRFDTPISTPSLPSNVSSPNIKRVNSYDVDIHVQKIKHNMIEFLDPLFVVFDSFNDANSFKIQYSINAANIPHEVTGLLHIVIEK